MDTMNFSVPDSLKDFVLQRVTEGGFGSPSEYIRELIRADQNQRARAVLESEVLKGVRSPRAPMTNQDWADIRAEVLRRHEARTAGQNHSC
jgi:antitoxin ParD1/3/4